MTLQDKFAQWFMGNQQAINFASELWHAVQGWDDLHDEGGCEGQNTMVAWWAFGKEYDPFFMQWAHILRPVMLQAYLSWTAANVLERGDRRDVEKALVLRAQLYSVWHVMAWITGGDAHGANVGPDIWRTYGETVDELVKEFEHA